MIYVILAVSIVIVLARYSSDTGFQKGVQLHHTNCLGETNEDQALRFSQCPIHTKEARLCSEMPLGCGANAIKDPIESPVCD